MVGSVRNRSAQRQRRLIITVSQIETLIVLLATAVLFLWGRWRHDLAACYLRLRACSHYRHTSDGGNFLRDKAQ